VRPRLLLLLPPSLLLGGGCRFSEPQAPWTDQLQADGPCWRVDLGDGLDEGSTQELHDLYDCVDRQGAIAPLGPTMETMDSLGRTGVPLGIDLARLVNHLPDVDIDPLNLARAALDLLEAPDAPLTPLLEVGVELIYGQPYATVAASPDLGSQLALDQGVLRPLLPVLGADASALLQGGDAVPDLLATVVDDPATLDLACTLAGLADTTDPEIAALGAALVPDMGDALVRATDRSNDRWSEATGDSLRDLVSAGMLEPGEDGQTALVALRPELLDLLGDALVVANLRQTLGDARDQGRLAPLPAQLQYLSEVDVSGGSLSATEDSALLSLLRLLDSGNTEAQCSIDLVFTSLDFNLGNLSVALLSALADQDPQAAASGIDLLGSILGGPLTQGTLELVASTGVCPVIDDQLVTDLGSIDRLSDPEVGDLLVVLLMVLDDARSGEADRLVDVVDLASAMVDRGLVPPLEEVLADLGSTAAASDLVQVLGVLLDPVPLQVDACPTGSRPLDLEGMVGLVHAALADRSGGVPLDVLRPVLDATLGADGTWSALGHLGALAHAASARTRELLPLLARVLAVDPSLSILRDLAPVLQDASLRDPALRMLEAPALLDALGAPTDMVEGPLPWAARLVVGGTVESLLRTISLVVDSLRAVASGDASSDTSSSTGG